MRSTKSTPRTTRTVEPEDGDAEEIDAEAEDRCRCRGRSRARTTLETDGTDADEAVDDDGNGEKD